MASMMSYTQAATGELIDCDQFADFYLKNPDIMDMTFGSDGPVGPCRETYYRKKKEEIVAKEKEAEPYCAKVLPTKKFCAVDCANNRAPRLIVNCLRYFPLCRPQLCGQCNKKFEFLNECKL